MDSRELSQNSMGLLESKFAELTGKSVWVPDWKDASTRYKTKSAETVLLMGYFFHRIFELNYWPENDFALFCLSTPVKKVLVEMFGFDADKIGVVPRYELFPLSQNLLPFPQLTKAHFVHAGRISPQKNIEFLILLTFHFQVLIDPSVRLSLFGPFDSEYHHDSVNFHYTDYKKKITQLIDSLPWPGEKPVIETGFSSEDWLHHMPENAVMVSASTLLSEDFSVSIAQAQEKGWPCLLPHWGAFQDVIGNNVLFYDVDLVADSSQGLNDISKKARAFVLQKDSFQKSTSNERLKLNYPKKMNRDYLKEKMNENLVKWGPDLQFIIDDNFPAFVKSETAAKFFPEFRRIFSGKSEH